MNVLGAQNSAEAHFLLGYILFKQQKARSLPRRIHGGHRRTPTAYDLEVVASDYVLLGDYPDAAKWYSKAVEWDPRNFQARYYLGRARYAENLFEEAIEAFSACLKLDPHSVKAENNLGLALEALARTDEAMSAYRTAIAWQSDADVKTPDLCESWCALIQHRPPRWLLPLLEAVQIDPAGVNGHRELGKAYSHLEPSSTSSDGIGARSGISTTSGCSALSAGTGYRKRGLIEGPSGDRPLPGVDRLSFRRQRGKATQAH